MWWFWWLGGGGAGVEPEPEATLAIGGQRYGGRRRKLQPYKTEGRTVPVGDELYRQMFPNAKDSTTVEPTSGKQATNLPTALLIAWMAGFDE